MNISAKLNSTLVSNSTILDSCYIIIKTLGEGQYAKVKLAENSEGSVVAIKIWKKFSPLRERIYNFLNEVSILSILNHQNILKIHKVSIKGIYTNSIKNKMQDNIYYVMQYAKHGELFRIVKETGKMTENLARTIMIQVLKGIKFLHDNGICHRDIKPENILLDEKFNVLIADFGCSSIYKDQNHNLIQFDSKILVGSSEYNAPEITCGQVYNGCSADIFLIGVTLFFLVGGCSPFRVASQFDPYFANLCKKDKNIFWKSFKKLNFSNEFKDIFEKLTFCNPGKRISMLEIFNHPWMQGPVLNKSEIEQDLGSRMTIVEKILLKLKKLKELKELKFKKIENENEIEIENELFKEKSENKIHQSTSDFHFKNDSNSILTNEELNNLNIKIQEINEKLKVKLAKI